MLWSQRSFIMSSNVFTTYLTMMRSKHLSPAAADILQRVPAGLDVLNEIWAWNDAKSFLLKQAAQDEDICAPGVPSYVDEMMQLIKQLQISKISSLEAENLESTEPTQPQSGKIFFLISLS